VLQSRGLLSDAVQQELALVSGGSAPASSEQPGVGAHATPPSHPAAGA
jgi:hypothetical protein